ncbi:MAG TPA: signal peptidase I [Candidatus Eisenbacteria bacterium]|jgi:signal peptidase I
MRETVVARPRKWWLAGFLSSAAPGLGQLYNGQWHKTMLLWAAAVVAPVLIAPLLTTDRFLTFMVLFMAMGAAVGVGVIVDAIIVARRLHAYELRPFNRVLVYLAVVAAAQIATTGVAAFIRANVVQAFRMPSESMRPTLLLGDFFFADKSFAARKPGRGELIVHRFPPDPAKIFVKRVVALGGDTVELRDKVLYVNGNKTTETYTIHTDSVVRPAGYDYRDNFGPATVPSGSYFVLGDNRDNSNDSRYWGPLEGRHVLGRVRGIYWSWDSEAEHARWDRIGRIVL